MPTTVIDLHTHWAHTPSSPDNLQQKFVQPSCQHCNAAAVQPAAAAAALAQTPPVAQGLLLLLVLLPLTPGAHSLFSWKFCTTGEMSRTESVAGTSTVALAGW